jgi:hypothetical protein
MGTLTPGATLIYERANGVIYAREFGKPDRQIVGYGVDGFHEKRYLSEWNEILRAAETNPALQEALERVKVIYNLIKDSNDGK